MAITDAIQIRIQQTRVTGRFPVDRRQFLATSGAAASGILVPWHHAIGDVAKKLSAKGKSCILLWMQGGPSQFETFDPKPGRPNGGPTGAINTSVLGVKFSADLPRLAAMANDLCVIRSVNSREGSHPRAQYLMRTGYIPLGGLQHPELGSHAARVYQDPKAELPGFVRIAAGRKRRNAGGGAGFLGVQYDPLRVSDPGTLPANTTLMTDRRRYQRRLSLLRALENNRSVGMKGEVATQRQLVDSASRMVLSSTMKVFDLEQEDQAMRQRYGTGDFADGCLLARRLVEAGTPFVEVQLGGWDTHADNFNRTTNLCHQLDQPAATLLEDLRSRGLLESTLVVWMGDFGRTPRINGREGRDHFPRAYSVWLAGAGIQGGQVIGSTDPDGMAIADHPVSVNDLLHTIYHALDIDPNQELMAGNRPLKVAGDGKVIVEAFS